MLDAQRIADEPRIRADGTLRLQNFHEFLPQAFRAYGDHEVRAVLCSKNLVGNDAGMSISPPSRLRIGVEVAAADVRQPGELRIEERHIQKLAMARFFAREKCA